MADLKQQIKQLIVTALNLEEEVSPNDIPNDGPLFGEGLGLDSVDALELAVEFERVFGVTLPEGDDSRAVYSNVNSLAEFISAHRAA